MWHGSDAVNNGLIDAITCSDDLLLSFIQKEKAEILQLKYIGDKYEKEEKGNLMHNNILDTLVHWLSAKVMQRIMGDLSNENYLSQVKKAAQLDGRVSKYPMIMSEQYSMPFNSVQSSDDA